MAAKGGIKKKSKNEVWNRLKKIKAALGGLGKLSGRGLVALLADILAPYGYDDQDATRALQFPSWEHWMGTDVLGRDIFSRLLYGARVSLGVGFAACCVNSLGGTALGIVAGYYGGWTDNAIMRIVDILMSIPSILLSIAIAATLGPGMGNAFIAMAIAGMPIYSRMIRAVTLSESGKEYVRAAKATNAGDFRILTRYIFPNIFPTFIILFTLGMAACILVIASLSFIGLGAQPPTPEWGAMLSDGRDFIRDYPFMVLYPGLAIMFTIFALNLFGDGLRDALDPKLRGGR
jgi:peptide/nickel transport system permease protein